MLPAALLLALLGCDAGEAPRGELSENAQAAFAACEADPIRALALRQRVQLAFAPCGANRVLSGAWSPDGLLLAFRLADGVYVLDGVNHQIVSVPGEAPTAQPAWLGPSLLALPLAPQAGQQGARVAFADLRASTYDVVAVALRELEDLQPSGDRLLLTAVDETGARHPRLISRAGGDERALPWLEREPARLRVGGDLACWVEEGGVVIADALSGERLARVEGATLGVPHPSGRYVALELPGDPVSLFDQRPWGEFGGSEAGGEGRARAEEREARWAERLPPGVPREARPPEVQILDLESGARWRVRAWSGEGLSWYAANPDHLSLMLWGMEGVQVQRNVALAPVLDRIRAAEVGIQDPGLERVSPE